MLTGTWKCFFGFWAVFGLLAGEGGAVTGQVRLRVLFNNVQGNNELEPGWGFACLVQGLEKTLLFDTGANGKILLQNMQTLGFSPKDVDLVVISHNHFDHMGGLEEFLRQNPKVKLFLPEKVARSLKSQVDEQTEVIGMSEPGKIHGQVYSTGSMGKGIEEQALVLDLPCGLVILTGCAHPGVVNIVRQARKSLDKKVALLMGGFHLMNCSLKELEQIAASLKDLEVEKISPSHCTGDRSIEFFRQKWGKDFLSGGLGEEIVIESQGAKRGS